MSVLFFISIPIAHFISSASYYLAPDFDEVLHHVYANEPFPESKVVGDFLNSKMKTGDQLFVAGSEPQIYVYANTLGISRHNFLTFLTVNSPYAKQWTAEAIKDIEIKKPRFMVLVMHPFSWMFDEKSDMTFYNWMLKYVP